MTTTIARTLAWLKKRGVPAAKVEQWVPAPWLAGGGSRPGAGVRRDLFGFIDVLAIGMTSTGQDKEPSAPTLIGIQCCGASDMQPHLEKIRTAEHFPAWITTGSTMLVFQWRKLKFKRGGKAIRWVPKIVKLTWLGAQLDVSDVLSFTSNNKLKDDT